MKVAIIGASGYAGGELIRLLHHHSSAKITCATSRKLAGTPLVSVHPHLKGFTDLNFENPDTSAIDVDVAFLAEATSTSIALVSGFSKFRSVNPFK